MKTDYLEQLKEYLKKYPEDKKISFGDLKELCDLLIATREEK